MDEIYGISLSAAGHDIYDTGLSAPGHDIYDTGLSAPGHDIYGTGSFICVLGTPDFPGTIDGSLQNTVASNIQLSPVVLPSAMVRQPSIFETFAIPQVTLPQTSIHAPSKSQTILPHSSVSQQMMPLPLAHQPSVPVSFVPPQMIPHSFEPSVSQFSTPPQTNFPAPAKPQTILPHSSVSQQIIPLPLAHQPSVPVPFLPPQMIPHSFEPSVSQFNTPPQTNFPAPAKSQAVVSQQSNTLPSPSSSNQRKSSQNLPEPNVQHISLPKPTSFTARNSQTAITHPSGSPSLHFSPPENVNASRSSQNFPEPNAAQHTFPKRNMFARGL